MIVTAVGARFDIGGHRSVLKTSSHKRETVVMKLGHALPFVACLRTAQTDIEPGVDKTRHNDFPMDGNIERIPRYFQILHSTGRSDGNNQTVLHQDRTVLDETEIAKIRTATGSNRAAQR